MKTSRNFHNFTICCLFIVCDLCVSMYVNFLFFELVFISVRRNGTNSYILFRILSWKKFFCTCLWFWSKKYWRIDNLILNGLEFGAFSVIFSFINANFFFINIFLHHNVDNYEKYLQGETCRNLIIKIYHKELFFVCTVNIAIGKFPILDHFLKRSFVDVGRKLVAQWLTDRVEVKFSFRSHKVKLKSSLRQLQFRSALNQFFISSAQL